MTMKRRTAMAGLSLVELMVALVISLVLMLGVVQVFIASQTASRLSEGASRVQENARFALDFLERDIRMAGHMGCVNDQAHVVKNQGDPVSHLGATSGAGSPLDFSVSIQGFDAPGTAPGGSLALGADWSAPQGLPAAIAGLSPAPAGGSDVLLLRFFAPMGVPVTAISSDGGDALLDVDSDHVARLTSDGISTPTLFGIADCGHADVFAGTLSAARVTATSLDLSRYVAQPTGQTMLYRAESMVYYVGINPETKQPGLRRARADSDGEYKINEELVEGIESLQLMYGLDNTANISISAPPAGNITQLAAAGGVSTDANAEGAAQWLRVGQVQVGLLARSPSPSSSAQSANALSVLGVEFTNSDKPDGRYRSSYEVSIALRNRLFGN
ncbi:TPA: PilW family protein [Stenotrophomonas maltophilia]|jgi:type IV pilus assembly protein PilW|nr:PilW family protein [Stenotrophomonas maltophilia]HEL3195262.1 PilW family protein [Stenotrophomonas maltophilia]